MHTYYVGTWTLRKNKFRSPKHCLVSSHRFEEQKPKLGFRVSGLGFRKPSQTLPKAEIYPPTARLHGFLLRELSPAVLSAYPHTTALNPQPYRNLEVDLQDPKSWPTRIPNKKRALEPSRRCLGFGHAKGLQALVFRDSGTRFRV